MGEQEVKFEVIFDLEVDGKTLFDVEFTINPDGNYCYRVPDCIRDPTSDIHASPKYINQVTMKGITTVSNDAFIAALLKKAENLE